MVVCTVVTTTVTTDSPTSVSAEDTSSTVADHGARGISRTIQL